MMYLGKEFNETANIPAEFEEDVLRKMRDLFETYDHQWSYDGTQKIYNVWKANKGWLWDMFSTSPYWNGKGQIVISHDFNPSVDMKAVDKFIDWLYFAVSNIMNEYMVGLYTYREILATERNLRDAISYLSRCEGLIDYADCLRTIYTEITKRRKELTLEWQKYEYLVEEHRSNTYFWNGKYYKIEDINRKDKILDCFYDLRRAGFNRSASEDFANTANNYFPEVKAVAGQKCSRIVGKILRLNGIDKVDGYAREFTVFADAINPIKVKRYTVISINPIDYLTMSFGHKWNSCHTIDKKGKRQDGDVSGYGGCFCSGTLSYMLDGASIVFYTVDASYEGNELELEDKMTRNMFHLGKDKLIQGRYYPICEYAGAKEAMTEVREIVQRMISEAVGAVNLWKVKEGTTACARVTNSYGTHYRDYTHYPNVNVSFWKGDGREELNTESIDIGHNPICPECGREHHVEDWLCCDVHNGSGYVHCSSCGDEICIDDAIEIDGEYYCRDCATYCEYHEEWELNSCNSFEEIPGYGTVCEDALEYSGDFVQIEDNRYSWDTNWRYIDSVYSTEDGRYFEYEENMLEAGYDEGGNIVTQDDEDDGEEVVA